ncbi:MAG TPA: HD domain-containing phosphohydrolase [Solirubrobacteraceae bacterium]|jgi:putative two-component system response regulator|nr:HD domain-containing phosphohydrolase [Solirubrobacteraceae bacterium]
MTVSTRVKPRYRANPIAREDRAEEKRTAELLIVDDNEPLRRWAERVMREGGYTCDSAGGAAAARECLEHGAYSLVLLDVNMPGESGMELLARTRSSHPGTGVLMITGHDDPKLAMTAIEHGAYGYMVKPLRSGELLISVANALHRRRRELTSQRRMQSLEDAVDDRSRKLEAALEDLRLSESKVSVAQAETILRLARIVEFRDDATGQHVQRMSSYCEILARQLGLPEHHCELLRLSSQLHDVGKVAIHDSILCKPGRLTAPEQEVMETHAEIGYEMLAGSASEVVQMGALIARTHHERWDGNGYPRGLAGEEIPRDGRIAAVADVFDALTSDRVYRPAFPVRLAIDKMQAERASHFDPEVLDAFMAALPEVEAIRRAYGD